MTDTARTDAATSSDVEPATPDLTRADVAAGPAGTPVQAGAILHRSEFTPPEWDVLQNGCSLIIGLSNHGYDFPGSIETFRAGNTATPVLSYVELSAIHIGNAVDDRFDQYDVVEDTFFHSTDPASLRALAVDGGVALTFMRDSRDRSAEHYTAPGVAEYLIESAPWEHGPWAEVAPPVQDKTTLFTTVYVPEGSAVAWYRVRSRLGDDTIVDYSWPQKPASGTGIVSGWLDPYSSSFAVVVTGPTQPPPPDEVFIEIDFDRDRVWGEPGERLAAETVTASGTVGWLYTGEATITEPAHYRFVIEGRPGATAPADGESYTLNRRNNRLSTNFSALLTKPGHPVTRAIHLERLEDALAERYDGVHFDFAYDDFSASWITAGDVAPREAEEAATLVDDVSALLAAMRNAHPDATILFNGFFVVERQSSFDTYLEQVSGGAYEFFAFGFDPDTTDIHPWSIDALDGILRASHFDAKTSVAVVMESETNLDARLKSLALYLLVAHERVHYIYMSGTEQAVEWYPEWSVPLGDAELQTLTGYDDLAHPASSWLSHRSFTNGGVYFNWHETEPIVIDLPATYYQLLVTGGRDPRLGGDGAVRYEPVDQLTIMPRDGAIVVTHPHPAAPAAD